MALPNKYMTTYFRLTERPTSRKKSVHLMLATDDGPKLLYCPKWAVTVYRYVEDEQLIYEAAIQDWLLEKAGLICNQNKRFPSFVHGAG